MSWSALFGFVNVVALIGWFALIVLPRGKLLLTVIFYCGIGLLCLVYGVFFLLLVTGSIDSAAVEGAGAANFTSIEGVRNIFLSDGGATIGWTHYLAFDLFVGLWIAREGDARGFSRLLQTPVLLVTLFAGPLGLFIWLVIREPAARRAARKAGKR